MDHPETIDLTENHDTTGAPKTPVQATTTTLIPPRARPTPTSTRMAPPNRPVHRSQAFTPVEWPGKEIDLLMKLRDRGMTWRNTENYFPDCT